MGDYVIKRYLSAPIFVERCVNEMGSIADKKDSDYSSIAIICNSEFAQELFKYFITMDFDGYTFDFGYLDFDYEYDKEYAITITNDGLVSIDKVYDENGFMEVFDEDLIYIHEYCSSVVKLYQEKYRGKDIVIDFSIENEL